MKAGKTEKTEKTNVMRLLDAAGIAYRSVEYPVDENDLSGVHVAAVLGQDVDTVFKTLVLKGEKTGYLVCCIPVAEEMIPMKDLLAVTGYIRGGCSPIGMKKKFPTYIEETAVLFDEIAVSAGVRGAQIIINPEQLKEYVGASFAGLVQD